MTQQSKLTPEHRATFAGLAELLIPQHGRMPAITALAGYEKLLDRVLAYRPDIVDDLIRGLESARGLGASEAANRMSQKDAGAFNAISLAASACYYMSDEVKELLGYPGQDKSQYDPDETPVYLSNGMIERVMRRGPIYRTTDGK